MSKSHVSMETNVCPVCGVTFETGSILLDKKLRNKLDSTTLTGMSLCPEHQKLHNDGYLALVEIDPTKSIPSANGRVKPEDAYRTGKIIHIRYSVAKDLFNVDVGDIPFTYIDPQVSAHLESMMPENSPS